MYRFITLIIFAFKSDLNTYYSLVQVQFAVILTIHAICQPYKRRCHNIIDALLFANLSAINAITLYNFNLTSDVTVGHTNINIASTVQVILLYLPVIYLLVYTIKKTASNILQKHITKKLISKVKRRNKLTHEPNDYHRLSSRFSLNVAEERMVMRSDTVDSNPTF